MKRTYIITEQQSQRLSDDEATRKYIEFRKLVDSGEYEKQKKTEEENKRLEREKEFERQRNEKYTKAGRLSHQKASELELAKQRNASELELKIIERDMIEYKRDSFEETTEQWEKLNVRYHELIQEVGELEKLDRLEKEEKRKEDELKRQEEERRRNELEQIEKDKIEKLNLPLKKFIAKTVNIYNDRAQQKLYGTETIKSLSFYDGSREGMRSGILINTNDGTQYELICLANPNRFADYLVLDRKYTSDYKYNATFVTALSSTAPNFCKKPKADFATSERTKTNNIA
jgi:hypothetical protein